MSFPKLNKALSGLTERIPVQIIKREITDHEVVESIAATERISGLLLPMPARKLLTKAEGERSWKWYELTTVDLLELGWTFVDLRDGFRYRVMSIEDQHRAGFYKYDLVQRAKPPASGDA